MALRYYSNTAQPTSINNVGVGIDASQTTIPVVSTADFPTAPFTIAVDRGTATEEAMLVTSYTATEMEVQRGFDGTETGPNVGYAHDHGAQVEHVAVALDYREANKHIEDDTRDDHSQYYNEARLALVLPQVYDDATVTSAGGGIAIATLNNTYKTQSTLVIPSATFDRKAQFTAMLPWGIIDGSEVHRGIITTSLSNPPASFYGAAVTYGAELTTSTIITDWVSIPANSGLTVYLRAKRDSGSGGTTSSDANLNKFTALVVADL